MRVQFPAGATCKFVEVDAAIVDLDGTMVDTIGDFAEAITRMLADLQLSNLPASEVEHMVGKGTEHLLRSVLAYVLAQSGHPTQGLEEAVQALFGDGTGALRAPLHRDQRRALCRCMWA